jgi:hypothetical protein
MTPSSLLVFFVLFYSFVSPHLQFILSKYLVVFPNYMFWMQLISYKLSPHLIWTTTSSRFLSPSLLFPAFQEHTDVIFSLSVSRAPSVPSISKFQI